MAKFLKLCRGRNRSPVFAAFLERPFKLPHYCKIDNFQVLFSNPNNEDDGPDVPSETTAITFVSDVRCEGSHCHADGSQLATDLFPLLKQHVGGP